MPNEMLYIHVGILPPRTINSGYELYLSMCGVFIVLCYKELVFMCYTSLFGRLRLNLAYLSYGSYCMKRLTELLSGTIAVFLMRYLLNFDYMYNAEQNNFYNTPLLYSTKMYMYMYTTCISPKLPLFR